MHILITCHLAGAYDASFPYQLRFAGDFTRIVSS